jgi:Cu/Zn superoxide dismutase
VFQTTKIFFKRLAALTPSQVVALVTSNAPAQSSTTKISAQSVGGVTLSFEEDEPITSRYLQQLAPEDLAMHIERFQKLEVPVCMDAYILFLEEKMRRLGQRRIYSE